MVVLERQAILIKTSNKVTRTTSTGKFKNLIILILSKFIKSYLYSMTENQLLLINDAQVLVSNLLATPTDLATQLPDNNNGKLF